MSFSNLDVAKIFQNMDIVDVPLLDCNLDTKMSLESEQTMNELFKEDFEGVETDNAEDSQMEIDAETEMKSIFSDDFSEKQYGSDNNDDIDEVEQG